MEQLPANLDWPVGLSVDVALNEASSLVGDPLMTDEELCKHHHISVEVLDILKRNPLFRAEVRQHLATIKQENMTVRKKAALSLEHYLGTWLPNMMVDASISPDVKLKAVQMLAKLSGVEQSEKSAAQVAAEVVANTKNQPTINLIFPNSMQMPTVVPSQTLERV